MLACARVILIRLKRDHVTSMLLELHWLPVKCRITFKTLLLPFKCLHGLAPTYYCPTRRHAVCGLLTSYYLISSLPELKLANDPSLVQLQGHGTNYPCSATMYEYKSIQSSTQDASVNRLLFLHSVITDNQSTIHTFIFYFNYIFRLFYLLHIYTILLIYSFLIQCANLSRYFKASYFIYHIHILSK